MHAALGRADDDVPNVFKRPDKSLAADYTLSLVVLCVAAGIQILLLSIAPETFDSGML